MIEINACGMSCPQPLIMLKSALNSEKNLTLICDSKNVAENCTNFAKRQNCSVESELSGEIYKLKVKKLS